MSNAHCIQYQFDYNNNNLLVVSIQEVHLGRLAPGNLQDCPEYAAVTQKKLGW
jgi:hypothetical protein